MFKIENIRNHPQRIVILHLKRSLIIFLSRCMTRYDQCQMSFVTGYLCHAR